MHDPVFVDTSDGKALVADSLKPTKPQTDTETNKKETGSNPREDVKRGVQNVPEVIQPMEVASEDKDVPLNSVTHHRGGMYVYFTRLNKRLVLYNFSTFYS